MTVPLTQASPEPRRPRWYPIALALTTLPCASLGGVLQRKGQA